MWTSRFNWIYLNQTKHVVLTVVWTCDVPNQHVTYVECPYSSCLCCNDSNKNHPWHPSQSATVCTKPTLISFEDGYQETTETCLVGGLFCYSKHFWKSFLIIPNRLENETCLQAPASVFSWALLSFHVVFHRKIRLGSKNREMLHQAHAVYINLNGLCQAASPPLE